MHAVFVYSIRRERSHAVTDGMSDALYPHSTATASISTSRRAPTSARRGWLDMSSIDRPQSPAASTWSCCARTCPRRSPPESDEEKVAAESKPSEGDSAKDAAKADDKTAAKGDEKVTKPKPTPPVTIDFENLGQRIVSLPIPARTTAECSPARKGRSSSEQLPLVDVSGGPPTFDVIRFDLDKRKVEPLAKGLSQFYLSGDGEKMLVRSGKSWAIHARPTKRRPAGEGALDVASMQIYVDPPCRVAADVRTRFGASSAISCTTRTSMVSISRPPGRPTQPYLAGVGSRDDLKYLFEEMTGEHQPSGTCSCAAATAPHVDSVKVGLLGADYTHRQRPLPLRPHLSTARTGIPTCARRSPQPGVNVARGRLPARRQRPRRAARATTSTATSRTRPASRPSTPRRSAADGAGARDVTVVPVDSEKHLRNLAWIDATAARSTSCSGGQLAYVYLPDTAGGGYTNFNRYFFSQVGQEGAIIDERFNDGGDLADYIIDYLRRTPMSQRDEHAKARTTPSRSRRSSDRR